MSTLELIKAQELMHRIIYGSLGFNLKAAVLVRKATTLFNSYSEGTWSDRAYRAIWHACPERI
jgi:hypothetical protein